MYNTVKPEILDDSISLWSNMHEVAKVYKSCFEYTYISTIPYRVR